MSVQYIAPFPGIYISYNSFKHIDISYYLLHLYDNSNLFENGTLDTEFHKV